ncbi:glyoxylase I 4-like isoform X1 [Rosa rugosa]|uniref:glyoxylase I 4-like isoform X1 n=1 Tax=Rosa rugosa TaxID=74645 RepID=UPI002B411A0F|nr:glyoxylase I 4-like isoform X1 [Rosa rugosa]
MAAMVARVTLDHIARQSNDIRRLADFYIETFGFEEVESPKIGPLKVIWLSLPSGFTIHLIESNPSYPPNQRNDTSPGADPARIPRGHHMCFCVSNFETFVQTLKEKGIQIAHRPVQFNPKGSKKIDQVFFFDPDGNALEVSDSTSTALQWSARNGNAN